MNSLKAEESTGSNNIASFPSFDYNSNHIKVAVMVAFVLAEIGKYAVYQNKITLSNWIAIIFNFSYI